MQSTIRKRRCNESNRRIELSAFACIKRLAIGFLLLALSAGCAQLTKSPKSKPFSSLCLSGEGKGRIEHLNGTYVFSYENILKENAQEWMLALSLPLHGEEVLTIGFANADQSKVSVKGKFFKRMVYAAHKNGNQIQLKQLQKVLTKIGLFLKVVNLVRIGDYSCKSGVCGFGEKHNFSYVEKGDELNAQFPFDENHEFLITAKSNSSYYRKINFLLRDKRRRSEARQPFSLSLIHRECLKQ